MKNQNRLLLLLGGLLLTGCTKFFLGEENLSAPQELPSNPGMVGFSQQWSRHIGSGTDDKALYLRPLVVGNTVYAVSSDGELAAVAMDSGNKQWETKIGHPIAAGVGGDQNVVVVGSENGLLLAFDAQTGQRGWIFQLNSEILAAPTVVAGLVVARSIDGQVTAIDARSGQEVWKQYIGVADLSIRGNSRAVFLDGVLLYTNGKGRMTLLSIADGSPIFSAPIIQGRGMTAVERIADLLATPVVRDGVLFVSAYRYKTMAIDLKTGGLVWQSDYGTSLDLFADNRYVYIADKNSIIHALDKNTGDKVWTSSALQGRKISPLSGDGRVVVTIDLDGVMTALNTNDGKVVGYNSVGGSRSYVAPQWVKGKWLTYTSDGDLALSGMSGR